MGTMIYVRFVYNQIRSMGQSNSNLFFIISHNFNIDDALFPMRQTMYG